MTLLRLFRKYPDVIPVTDWADRLIGLMDEYDLVCSCELGCSLDVRIHLICLIGSRIVRYNPDLDISTELSHGICRLLREGC